MSTRQPVAVITGASSGFGYATALRFAGSGWHVLAGMRDLAKGPRLEEAAAGLSLSVVELDVTSDASVRRAFDAALAHGSIDALINNAGIAGGGPFESTTDADNRQMMETNYFGPLRCIRAVLTHMRTRGQGAIANVTSTSALLPWPNQAGYAASKWALEGFSASLAHEVRRFGIRVVNIEPGAIRTEIIENSQTRTHFDRESPYSTLMRRNGRLIAAGFRGGTTPDDVADVILEAITSPTYRLQWPVGADAVAILGRRHAVSLDEFVELGGDVPDEEYDRWFKDHLGIEL